MEQPGCKENIFICSHDMATAEQDSSPSRLWAPLPSEGISNGVDSRQFCLHQRRSATIIPHAVGIGSFNRVPSGPRLFYLKFRISYLKFADSTGFYVQLPIVFEGKIECGRMIV